jgi:tRNA dimethylallyltransferase
MVGQEENHRLSREKPDASGYSNGASPITPLLVIVGPTAAGKTALSLHLARQFAGEVISADSRLFYRGMDIGTAKPTAAEQAAVPHHFIDICDPGQTLTLGEYQRKAYEAIEAVQARAHLPIMVGGTGQYVTAVVEGWSIPSVAPQPQLRDALGRLGTAELSRWLQSLDPAAALNLDPRNRRRVIRALEVTLISGRPITQLQRKNPPPYRISILGLHHERESLYRKIDERVDKMIKEGLLAEVERLRQAGYERRLPAMSGLGYRQLLDHLHGEMTLETAVERIKYETHRFVRQQTTWFRHDDPGIVWFDAERDGLEQSVASYVMEWLNPN